MTPACVFLVVFALLGSKCVLSAADEDADQPQNATYLEEKQKADAEIQDILFGGSPVIRECMNVTFKHQTRATRRNQINQQPIWTVIIFREFNILNIVIRLQQCAGSLIHPKVVLTAAHCMYNKSMTHLVVAVGEFDKIQGKYPKFYQKSYIEDVVLTKGFDLANPKSDIALVFLENPFQLSGNLRTVCLPPPGRMLNINYARCFIPCWEPREDDTILVRNKNLKTISSPILPNYKCEEIFRMTGLEEEFKLDNSFICAGMESNNVMRSGNGGAPLICPICGMADKTIQVGVLSWGFNVTSLPGVLTSTQYSHDWIMKELRKKNIMLGGCEINWNA